MKEKERFQISFNSLETYLFSLCPTGPPQVGRGGKSVEDTRSLQEIEAYFRQQELQRQQPGQPVDSSAVIGEKLLLVSVLAAHGLQNNNYNVAFVLAMVAKNDVIS